MPFNSKNFCMFTGNLTRDVDLSFTPNGKAKLVINMVVNGRSKNKDGQWEEDATYVRVEYFPGESRAERLSELLRKGTKVQIPSFYKCDRVTMDDGTNKYYHKFLAYNVEILQWPKRDSGHYQESEENVEEDIFGEEEIPF